MAVLHVLIQHTDNTRLLLVFAKPIILIKVYRFVLQIIVAIILVKRVNLLILIFVILVKLTAIDCLQIITVHVRQAILNINRM